jgi:2,3-dihydroxybenzoate decarboxylase
MRGKIVVEEHFAIPETLGDSRGLWTEETWAELRTRVLDIHGRRLREMDQHGIEMMVLSLNAPAIQAMWNVGHANETARQANDYLAEQVSKQPNRFQGLAALPMQDAEMAAGELTRCVRELGLKGALVNGFSQVGDADTVSYYDTPDYWPFWQAVEKLGVPLYLHPRHPLKRDAGIYDGHAWLCGARWAFGQEAAVHALRLMGSGLFDKFPRLKIVLGHMGEGLPFGIWRVDNANGWVPDRQNYPARKKISDYFYANFYITTSAVFHTQTLLAAMIEFGADRILFSIDWPFEDISDGAIWFDNASISESDRTKIGRTNAVRLFGLNLA